MRGQDIVHWRAPRIFLDVYDRNVKLSFGRRVASVVKIEIVWTPFSAHKFERCESQVCDGFEAGHEHACETNGGEVTYGAHYALVVGQRNLELEPFHTKVFAVGGAL